MSVDRNDLYRTVAKMENLEGHEKLVARDWLPDRPFKPTAAAVCLLPLVSVL
jgi:hypothetical protein